MGIYTTCSEEPRWTRDPGSTKTEVQDIANDYLDSYFDPAFARSCININTDGHGFFFWINPTDLSAGESPTGLAITKHDPVTDDLWLHFEGYQEGATSSSTGHNAGFKDSTTGALIGITGDGTPSTFSLHINETKVGATFTHAASTRNVYDLYVKRHATLGEIKLYQDDSLVAEYTPVTEGGNVDTTGGGVGYDQAKFDASKTRYSIAYFSQMIVSTANTLGKKLATVGPNAAGTHLDFTGTFQEIDEAGAVDSSDSIFSDTIGDKSTFNFQNLDASILNYDVEIVILVSSVRNSFDSTVNDIKHLIRSGAPATEVASPVLNVIKDSSIQPAYTRYLLNPDGNVAWTKATVDAVEFGIENV